MNLINKKCPHCGSKQMEIMAAVNVGAENPSENVYRCPKCHNQVRNHRTVKEQQKTLKYLKSDDEIMEVINNGFN